MQHFGGNEAIALIAPELFEHFKGRGLVEFHVLLKKPPILLVSVQFLGERRPNDLSRMWSLATEAGLHVEQGCNFEGTLVIEIALSPEQKPPQMGVVVPFRGRRSGRVATNP